MRFAVLVLLATATPALADELSPEGDYKPHRGTVSLGIGETILGGGGLSGLVQTFTLGARIENQWFTASFARGQQLWSDFLEEEGQQSASLYEGSVGMMKTKCTSTQLAFCAVGYAAVGYQHAQAEYEWGDFGESYMRSIESDAVFLQARGALRIDIGGFVWLDAGLGIRSFSWISETNVKRETIGLEVGVAAHVAL